MKTSTAQNLPTNLNKSLPALLTRGQVATHFGVCKETIRRWERDGRIQPIVINARVLRYRQDDVATLSTSNN